jgi:hypothetical protein
MYTIYIPSFKKIDASVQAILKFNVGNLRNSNVGIIDGRDYELYR